MAGTVMQRTTPPEPKNGFNHEKTIRQPPPIRGADSVSSLRVLAAAGPAAHDFAERHLSVCLCCAGNIAHCLPNRRPEAYVKCLILLVYYWLTPKINTLRYFVKTALRQVWKRQNPQIHRQGLFKASAAKTKNESVFFDYSVLTKKVLVDIIHFSISGKLGSRWIREPAPYVQAADNMI